MSRHQIVSFHTVPYKNPAFWVTVLSMVVFVLVIAYMYFLSMSVVHVVFRKESHQEARQLESEISALESTYIEAQHAVSERIASAVSLTETNEKIFVTRVPAAVALSRTGSE
jgi:hypothetical protein